MNSANPFIRAIATRLKRRANQRWRLSLDEVRPLRDRVGWFFISIGITTGKARHHGGPAMTAIVSSGGRGVKPWIEARFHPTIEINGGTMRTRDDGIEDELIAIMGEVIPPGGHLMIDYESAGQEMTMAELQHGIPPAATSLGARMLAAGFIGEFKDWYFSEGGHEGPRKLQANKPPDASAARRAIENRIRELGDFETSALRHSDDPALRNALISAHRRAEILIDHLSARRSARQTIESLSIIDFSSASKARPARSAGARRRRLPPAPSR